MLRLSTVMLGTKQLAVMAPFYEKLLGRPADMADAEHGYHGWKVGETYLSVFDHSEMGGKTKDPGRIMFVFETAELREEFPRIKNLGATVVREPYEMGQGWIATLADPDGNFFQLMSPMG